MFNEVLGPILPWLKAKNDVNYEEVSRALMASGIGIVVGSALGGALYDRLIHWMDICLAVNMLVRTIPIIVIPWCQHLILLAFLIGINGVTTGALVTGESMNNISIS